MSKKIDRDFKSCEFILSFLSIQKQRMLINKKKNIRTRKISASANINPEPLFILSIKELNDAHPRTKAMVMSITPNVFKSAEILFFMI